MNQKELSHALRKEIIAQGRSVQILAAGYSMFPFLRKGDILTINPAPIDLIKRGDIVVYELNEKWIAHRVIHINHKSEGLEFLLRGDTCVAFDPPVNKENFIGKVSEFQRLHRQKKLNGRYRRLWTKLTLLKFNLYPFLARIHLRIHHYYLIQLKGLK
jgi:signal peptidase I